MGEGEGREGEEERSSSWAEGRGGRGEEERRREVAEKGLVS